VKGINEREREGGGRDVGERAQGESL